MLDFVDYEGEAVLEDYSSLHVCIICEPKGNKKMQHVEWIQIKHDKIECLKKCIIEKLPHIILIHNNYMLHANIKIYYTTKPHKPN